MFPQEKQVPEKFKRIISGCLIKDPKNRISAEAALKMLLDFSAMLSANQLLNRVSTRPLMPKVLHEDFEVPEEPIFAQRTVNERAEHSLTIGDKHKNKSPFSSLREIQDDYPQHNPSYPKDFLLKLDDGGNNKDTFQFKKEAALTTRRLLMHGENRPEPPGTYWTPKFIGKIKMSNQVTTMNQLQPEDIYLQSEISQDKKILSNILDQGDIDFELANSFQDESPDNHLYKGCASSPFTLIFSII